jgi:3-phenylpropionate/trans-cinnamate dioxygenase ferredoxin component
MSNRVQIASLADISPNSMRSFPYGDQRIAIYRVGETIYATDAICSHEEADLAEGWLEADDCAVECPLHGARFDLQTGQALSLPAYRPIKVYPVELQEEGIWVELP